MSKDSQYQYISSQLTSYLGPIKNYRVEVNGQQWRYLEGGEGEAIVFMHGLTGSKTQWRSLMQTLLKEGYRVIAIDVPGLNIEQGLENKKHNLRELSRWLDSFLAELKLEKCHLLSHSMGCTLGSYYAATRPKIVNSLTLLSFPDVLIPKESGNVDLWDRFKQSIYFESVEDIDRYMEDVFYKLPAVPSVVKKYSYQSFKKHQDKFLLVLDDLAESMPVVLTHIGKIQCPVLTVSGENDGWSSDKLLHELRAHMPVAKHVALAHCAHMCFFEKPIAVQKLCADFLGEVSLNIEEQRRMKA